MIDARGGNQTESGLANPTPEDDVLVMGVCLQTLLGLEVEQLQGPLLCLERDDGLGQVHDGAICSDRAANDVMEVLQVDDDGLGRGAVGGSLANAYPAIRLECLRSSSAGRSTV